MTKKAESIFECFCPRCVVRCETYRLLLPSLEPVVEMEEYIERSALDSEKKNRKNKILKQSEKAFNALKKALNKSDIQFSEHSVGEIPVLIEYFVGDSLLAITRWKDDGEIYVLKTNLETFNQDENSFTSFHEFKIMERNIEHFLHDEDAAKKVKQQAEEELEIMFSDADLFEDRRWFDEYTKAKGEK